MFDSVVYVPWGKPLGLYTVAYAYVHPFPLMRADSAETCWLFLLLGRSCIFIFFASLSLLVWLQDALIKLRLKD